MSYSLELVIGYLVCGVVGLFALLILWLILKGEINLDLLISEKTGEASMSRFQLLIFTFVIGLSFFLIVVSSAGLHSGTAGQVATKPVLPDVPGGVLALLGISATSYTVSKAIQMANKPAEGNPPAPANPPAPQNQPGPAGQAG
jgi:hypothetical protein